MSEDITYCINNKCYKRYRCELYRDAPEIDDERKNFWFVEYKPEICPERDKMNIWEKNYYEQIKKANKKYLMKFQEEKNWIKDEIMVLHTKIYNLLDGKISDEDMDKVLNYINEVGASNEKRGI